MYLTLPVPRGATAWWHSPLFLTPNGNYTNPIDVMGRARTLLFGPYISLTSGLWQADLTMEFCADAIQYDYLIDFGTAKTFARSLFRPARAGEQTVSIQYTVQDDTPVEMRVVLLRAAFHGEIIFSGARVTKLD
jgi:hypothetical protein